MNKQAELTRWTPKRLLSLLMALIMTLSLLPTAALANDETQTLHLNLNNFKTASGSGESESVVEVASGDIGTNGTRYRLSVHIDPKPDYAPGQKVDVRATADLLLKGGDQVDESHPLKVTVGKTAVTSEPNSSTSDSTSRTATDNSCTIGLDGSISFTTSIEYSVITSGSSEAITGSKTVPVKIEGLWTGYNVTFTTTEGLDGVTFTGGIPADGKAKTYARNAEARDFTPVYKLLASMGATKDGYTFEGWTFRNLKTADGSVIGGTVAAGTECEYTFGGDGTFTADLAKNQEITFDAGDYDGVTGILNKTQYSRGTKYDITVQDPKLDGYQFAGWLFELNGTPYIYKRGDTVHGITSATTLIAQWTPDDGSAPVGSHKVTFLENAAGVYNMPVSQTVVKDGLVAEPITPQRDGYTFGGWYKEPTCTTKWNFTTDTVTTDLELYAKWTATPVTVQITNLGAADGVNVINLTPNSSIGSEAHFTVQVPDKYNTSDLLVYAGDPQASYRMLAPVERVELKNTTTGVVESVMLYYQFTVTEDLIDVGTTGALTLPVAVGNVTEKTFNVTLPTGAGFDAKFTDPASDGKLTTVNYDGSVSFTVKARPGYTVEGVYANGVKLDPDTSTTDTYTIKNIKSNQAVMVDMAAVQFHTVTYVLDGAQMATQSVANGSNATSLPAPDKTGYNWDSKWYKDERYTSEFDFATEKITKDTILYGRYTPKTFTISYDELTDITTKTYGLAATLTAKQPTKEGHTFLGWSETPGATVASYLPGATFSKEIDHNITLYAVWQKNTYTITFSSGEGYSLHSGHGSMTVEHGGSFEFNLIVDPAYAQNPPSVWTNTAGVSGGTPINPEPTPVGTKSDGAKVYHYKLRNITEDIAINALVTTNATYTVTFKTNGTIYQTQQVEYDHKATQPVDPKVEGFTFGGWYREDTFATAWDFATDKVIENTTLYAKLDPIYPEITWTTPTATDGYTIEVKGTKAGTATTLTSPGTVDYGSTVTFTITILDGYDASKMQVGLNGVYRAAKDITDNVYTYEFIAKEDTKITVTGIERKTVTIIYNDNGGYGGPVQETVNYFLSGDVHNGKISKTVPTREGYDFLGWAKANDAHAPEYSNPAKTDPTTTDVADFTSDTVLYAVWKAKETGITLEVSNTIDDTATPKAQYEGEDVTLTATITSGTASVTTGSVQFYRCTDADPTAPAATWTLLNSAVVSGGTAIYTAETSGFKYGGTNTDTYKAVFIPTEGNGYTKIETTTEDVKVMSTAISWKLDTTDSTTHKIKDKANVLTIKDKDDHTVTAMVAGQVYTLELPAIYALDELNTKLTVNKDYSVTWQYRNDKGVWTDYTNSGSGDTTTVDAAYSQYVFRAVVTPVTGATSHFTKAAKYDTSALVKDQYETALISEPTTEVKLQGTKTDLVITGHNIEEDAGTVINGTAKFRQKHLAQFEGQTVILKATVIDSTSKNAVADGGKVYFYRYVDGTNDVKLNQTAIVVNNGIAELSDVTIKAYDASTGKYFNSDANIDRFYAVYEGDATYATSASVTYDASTGYAKPVSVAAATADSIFVKSTTIQTPIIDSTLPGKLNGADANSTSYEYDLTGLLAGVEHTFELRQTGAAATADNQFSVVAKDGRTVAAKNYDIEWQYKTTGNFAKADNDSTAAIYTTKTTKFGDQYRVVLNPKGDMKIGATSKVAEIGKKQDVTVTVKASADLVYQLNDITLTAEVAAADSAATMPPKGSVTFYYSVDGGTTWTKIGDTKDLAETAGVMTASITTNKLPVTAGTNTKQGVEITAVYEGNDTFAVSGNYNETSKEVSAGTTANGVADKTVTVYSSVVYVKDTVENKTTVVSNKTHESGIYIYAEDDKVLANEGNVNLKLSEVYTLDHATDAADKALLAYGTDYTVQWQMLSNAAAYPDKAAKDTPWTNIDSATGTTCQIDVEQGAAYRAVITVKDTPIAKGSFTEVQQAIPGHKVYYSNILVAANAPATLTVNVNTDNTSKGYEGIVEGETVTIHTFTSGATGTTPISQLTVNIYPGKPAEVAAATTPVAPVFTAEKANVNGHVSFDWNKDVTPGYYTLKVKATFTNGYDDKEITRTLIVRDNDYKFELSGDNAVYNGKVQGLNVAVQNMGIEDALAQKSVVVYYYTDEARTQQVEPTQAGTYYATVRLQESAYWTEKTFPATFTIKPREVSVVDLVAQAKVYDGTTNANIQEIILNDATVNSTTGLPTDDKGIIDGDSIYAVGTGYTSLATAGTADLGVKNVSLMGDDAANYDLTSYSHTEKFNIQRSQVKGAIVSGRTYKYTGKDIKLAASDIYLIDQAGSQLTKYDVTYYYHNGDGVEKVDAMNKMGKYTVIARPEQDNYKGGATAIVYVGNTDTPGTLDKDAKSSLITISNTVELYGAAGNKGIVATATNNATVTVQYQNGTGWSDARPTDAGRYLVKVTATNGSVTDTAYGLYTIVKARPEFTPTTDKSSMEYTSGRYDGAIGAGFVNGKSNDTAETYITYTGGTIQGVAYEAPTEVGKYIATVHVGETANYTAHEKQVAFEITPKALTIKADSISRQQYGAYPDLTASFKGLAIGGVAADTSLRDVQIQPELIFDTGYTNDADDQVGNNYGLTAAAALARNYNISYQPGNLSVTREDPKPYLEIRGMIENSDGATDLAYYGDVIQLYAYGNQIKTTTGDVYNTSSILAWSVDKPALADITQDGLLTVKGVGTVTVTLTRGIGAQQIGTTLTFKAKKQEVKVVVPAEDKVYDGTTQDYTSTKTLSAVNAMGTDVFVGNGNFVIANNTRSDVGSQIVTGKVSDSIHSFQSETYGGLFTINVKDVDIKPTAADTIYGTRATGLTYTEVTPAGSGKVLTDGKAVSVADVYGNLDVLDGYEILVAGRENENYNVKYVTDQDAFDVEVTAKDLTIKTGTLNSDGRTSGYLQDNDQFYKNEGFAITGTTFDLDPNDRMYGEVNPVMDYTFAGFVSGDSEADLVKLLPWLVRYSDGTYHNINGDANVAFDKTHHLSGFRAPSCMPGMSDYPIDSVLLANSVKNYTLTSTEVTQNIYQRPVTLKLREGLTKLTAYKPEILGSSGSVTTEGKAKLLELLLNNLVVDKYNGEGGLAELLKHTIEDLNIQIDTISVSADKLTLTLKLGNQNYWLDSASSTIEIELVSTKIVPVYSPLDWTSFTVTMYNETKTTPVAISGNVRFFIFQKKDGVELKYSNYKNDTIIRSGLMDPTGRTGEFRATFSRLPAGDYAIFAIAENYTIVE